MKPFKILKDEDKISSINRTIRLKPDVYEKLMLLSEESGVSFNKIVNQCIEYALTNMNND
ncbi:MAG: hypothetical protein ACRCW1_09405 [Anaerotignaceae bacterium]